MEENNPKIIKFNSMHDLYEVLKNHEGLTYKDSSLATFKDFIDMGHQGCKCRMQAHFDEAERIYVALNQMVKMEVINEFKNIYGVESFSFYNGKGSLLFIL
jgi:hypothetical protein